MHLDNCWPRWGMRSTECLLFRRVTNYDGLLWFVRVVFSAALTYEWCGSLLALIFAQVLSESRIGLQLSQIHTVWKSIARLFAQFSKKNIRTHVLMNFLFSFSRKCDLSAKSRFSFFKYYLYSVFRNAIVHLLCCVLYIENTTVFFAAHPGDGNVSECGRLSQPRRLLGALWYSKSYTYLLN